MPLNIIDYTCTKNRCYIQGKKRKPIGIQIHSIGCAQGTAKSVADYWNSPNVSALVHYICDSDSPGKVLKTLPEEIAPWADAGYGNRNLIAIEMCESDFMKYTGGASYYVTDEKQFKKDILQSYNSAVMLCADICRRYGWNPWSKLSSGLYLISSHNEGRRAGLSSSHVDPDHVWEKVDKTMEMFRNDVLYAIGDSFEPLITAEKVWYRVRRTWGDVTSQLGAYEVKENAINNCPYGYSVFDENGEAIYSNNERNSGLQASDFNVSSESVAADLILETVHKCDKSGIFYSVTAAQGILESGYVKTELARKANNCFGMKVNLSGNTWEGSTWDGTSKVNILTWEVYNGKSVQVHADFRKYKTVEDSIKDHSAYLLGAMNGSKKRYEGLLNAKTAKDAITIIKNGGYATDPNYISKILKLIDRFNLDQYDSEITGVVKKEEAPAPAKTYYRVQVGRFKSLALAKGWAATVTDITRMQCSVEIYEDDYQVVCGSFTNKEKADAVKMLLKKEFMVDSEVKMVVI